MFQYTIKTSFLAGLLCPSVRQSGDSLKFMCLCVLKGIVHKDFRFRFNPNSKLDPFVVCPAIRNNLFVVTLSFIDLAGTPATMSPSGTSHITTAPAPTMTTSTLPERGSSGAGRGAANANGARRLAAGCTGEL